MEELFALKDVLLKGDIPAALVIVDELEEMSRDEKISNIGSYAVILLIKQQLENRTTRYWDLSIRNSAWEIQKKNKRPKAGGYYLTPEELKVALEEAYQGQLIELP
jgi:hypothetical protein